MIIINDRHRGITIRTTHRWSRQHLRRQREREKKRKRKRKTVSVSRVRVGVKGYRVWVRARVWVRDKALTPP